MNSNYNNSNKKRSTNSYSNYTEFQYTVDLGQGTTQTVKTKIGVFNDEPGQDYLDWYHSFNTLATSAAWPAATKFRRVKNCLGGEPLTTVTDAANWTALTTALKDRYYPAAAANIYDDALTDMQKQRSETVEDYYARFIRAKQQYELASGETMTANETARIFKNGLPPNYQTKFIEHGDSTLTQILLRANLLYVAEQKLGKRQQPITRYSNTSFKK
jgi:hypothetical protein